MSKIAIDARTINSSTGRYVRELIRELAKLDDQHDYHVIVLKSDGEVEFPDKLNWHLHRVSYKPYGFGEQLGFALYLYKLRVQLVHFFMPQRPLLYLKRSVTTVHDLTLVHYKNRKGSSALYSLKQLAFKLVLWLGAHQAKAIITPSRYTKQDLVKWAHIKPNKVTVTYEAAAKLAAATEQEPVKEAEAPFILYVGNAFPYKNLEKLVAAMAALRSDHPKVGLIMVGKTDWFYKQLAKTVAGLELSHVQILGFVSDAQLEWLYRHAKVYVFPSLSEGFGLPGLEAMQHDLPVAASRATSLPEIYGEAAHYFDPNDAGDMARALKEILDDEQLAKRLVKAGQQQLAKYSWSKMAEQTLAVYNKVLN